MMTPFKQWMTEQELTNSALAARLGVTYDFIYKVAEGIRPVSDGLKWRIAKEFGVDVADKLTQPEPVIAQ
jgi:transcriptional regulator with XRE-family HTH domain